MNINKIMITILLTGSLITNGSAARPAKVDRQAEIIKAIAADRGYAISEEAVRVIKTMAHSHFALHSGLNLNDILPSMTNEHIDLKTGKAGSPDARK